MVSLTLVALLKRYKWDIVSVMSSKHGAWQPLAKDIVTELTNRNITVAYQGRMLFGLESYYEESTDMHSWISE